MATRQQMGAASPGTELRARGAARMERALGRMFSAGADSTTKAAYMESADRRGQEAAEKIRLRYFKTEFDQVLELQIKPETAKLQAKYAMMVERTKTATMAVPYIKSAEEVAQRQAAMGMTEQNIQSVQTGKVGAEGKPIMKDVITETPSENAGFQGDNLGVVESKELLSFLINGKPTPVDSAEGMAFMMNEHEQMGLANTATQQRIMNIAAKYQGNPFASQYMAGLMEQLQKQASITATGKTNPLEAVKFMEDREKFDQELETADLQQKEQELANQKAMGDRNALVSSARNRVIAGHPTPGMGDKLVDALKNGDDLTAQQQANVAAAERMNIKRINKRASEALKGGVGVKPMNEHNTQFWHGDLATGSSPASQEYRQEYTHSMDDSSAQEERKFLTLGELGTDRAGRQKVWFDKHGVDPDEQSNFWTTGEITEGIKKGLDDDAAAGGSRQKAQGIAMVKMLPKLEHENSEVNGGSGEISRQVDYVLDAREQRYWDDNNASDRPFDDRSMRAKIAYMRKYRAHTFVEETDGIRLPRPEEFKTEVGYRDEATSLGVAPAMIDGGAGDGGLLDSTVQAPQTAQAATVEQVTSAQSSASPQERTQVLKSLGEAYKAQQPSRQLLNALGESGGRELWRGGKELLNYNVLDAPQAISDQIDYEWDLLKKGARSLAAFATTGSFSPSQTAPVTSSSVKESPEPLKLPQLDSFEKKKYDPMKKFREGITAAGMPGPVEQVGERVHWRDRERGR